MSLIKTNVIIVGAGPAGTGASIFLSKAGIDHVLIDKAIFPRDKVCGDACSGKTLEVLRKANPDWVQEIVTQQERFLPSHGINFIAPNGKVLPVPYRVNPVPGEVCGITIPRMQFDDFLFEKCTSPHAKIFQGISALTIARQEKETTVSFQYKNETCQFSAPIIIGADGDKSLVAKYFTQALENEKALSVGLRAYYSGVTGMDANNFIELHYLKGFLPGYFWIFPLPNGMANVGVGMLSNVVRKKKINLREEMLKVIREHPAISQRFANAQLEGKILGWGLPLAMEQKSISGDGYMLSGDAASLVDPFSGEGIGNALYSGMLAAWAARDALAAQDFSASFFRAHYDKAVYRYFGDEFRISATLQKICNHPWIFNFMVNKSLKSKSLRDTLSGMFMDMQVRDQLRKPSFYLKVLFNK